MSDTGTYIVFIDLDKTLLTTNSGKALVWASYKKGYLTTFNLVKAITLSIIFRLRIINSVRITGLLIKWLRGVPETTVEELAEQVVKVKLISMLRPSMLREIEQHQSKGAQIVLLSASMPYVCKPLARYLKLDDVICSAMELEKGIFTGKTKGKICMEKEKKDRLRQYCHDNSYSLRKAYCYGDSYSDRFALESVGNPICVAPDKRLRKLSGIRKWPVIE